MRAAATISTLTAFASCWMPLQAHAEVINLPAVPITVADCRPSDEWRAVGGIARCQPKFVDSCSNHGLYANDQGGGSTFVAGVGTCYYAYTPPPPPACRYALNSNPSFYLEIGPSRPSYGDGGGGGGGVGYAVYWGTPFNSSTPTISGYNLGGDLTFNYNAAIAWVDSQLAAQGYSRGAYQNGTISDGNYAATQWFVVCH